MPIYSVLLWLVIGAVVGLLARRIFGKTGKFGVAGDIVIGIVGAIIGGYLLGLLGAFGTTGILISLLAAVVGAVLLLWILSKIIKS
jgi:uncharacterized membrane protein YeaQ/YmgE (transglycosylase-associated protein family)